MRVILRFSWYSGCFDELFFFCVPAFIAIGFYVVLERFLKKIIHKDIQMFLVPMLSLMIIVPLTVIALGPFGIYIGNGVGQGISFLSTKSGILTGAIMGGAWAFIVLTGLHMGLSPIVLENVTNGGDPLLAMASASIFAQVGVALGIFLKAKDKTIKSFAGSTLLPGALSGVTEPILYGLILRNKRTIPYIIITGTVGGAIIGFVEAKTMALALPSLLSILSLYTIGTLYDWCVYFFCCCNNYDFDFRI